MRGRPDLKVVLALSALGLALRLAWVLVIDRDSFAFNDSLFYQFTASTLADGDGYVDFDGSPTARWPPVYSFLLSLVYRVFGNEPTGGEILNAVVGTAIVPLAYLLARQAFGRTEATIAAGFAAIMPGQIMYTDILLAETLFAVELLFVFFLLAKLSPARWWVPLVIGAAIGVAALTRGEGLLLGAVPLAMWWREVPRRTLLLRMGAVAIGLVLALAPWAIRNYSHFDRFVLLGTNGGTTFWAGHNPQAHGGPNYAPQSLLLEAGPPDEKNIVFKQESLLRREALEFMVENPRRELELIPLKLMHLNRGDSAAVDIWLNSQEAGDEPAIAGNPEYALNVALDSFYYVLLALTIGSVVLLRRRLWSDRVLRGVLTLFAISLFFYGFLFYGNVRYRVPLEPLMMLVAAPVLAKLWSLREEDRRVPEPAG